MAVVAAALIGLAAAIAAPGAAQAATTSYDLDCNNLPQYGLTDQYTSQTFYVLPGDTITLNLTNFRDVYDINGTYTGPTSLTDGATVVLNAGDAVEFSDDSGETCGNYFDATVEEAAPETVPPGSLLFTQNISIPLGAPQIGPLTTDHDDQHFLNGDSTCGVSSSVNGLHVYGTLPITIKTAGTYAFRGISSTPPGDYVAGLNPFNPIDDPFLAVYSTFDPSQPDSGVIGCNDDQNDLGNQDDAQFTSDNTIIDGHQPYFTANFTPGRYTLVLLTWSDLSTQNFADGTAPYEDETFTPGAVSTTFQLWGVPGGLVLGQETTLAQPVEAAAPTVAAPTLAATGSDSTPGLIAAAILLFVGIVLSLMRSLRGRRSSER